MKRLVLTVFLLFGVIATSFNNSRQVETRPPVEEITISLDNLRMSLDSLNNVIDGKDN